MSMKINKKNYISWNFYVVLVILLISEQGNNKKIKEIIENHP